MKVFMRIAAWLVVMTIVYAITFTLGLMIGGLLNVFREIDLIGNATTYATYTVIIGSIAMVVESIDYALGVRDGRY